MIVARRGLCNDSSACQQAQKALNNGGTTVGTGGTTGGTGGGAPTGGEPDGGAPTGAASDDMATVSFIDIDELPGTGGPSLVLLLASALLSGSTLLLVAFVRSVRS